ncbi:hypothetical protein [Nocardia sp. CNY236]|uniref:Rv0361 family membrane protein n=1 Tax=Nocardia sp. CNY236 TaxID=1169152 RepID=UPI0004071905|nr:hypothetical protein [Nocardia sp. CNY236]
MTEQQPTSDEDPNIRIDQTDKRTLVPFVAAGVVAVVVLIAIVLTQIFSTAEKNVTTSDRIGAAVHNFVEGYKSTDTMPPPDAACEDFDAGRWPLARQMEDGKSVDVTEVGEPTVNGDRAETSVTTKVDGVEATTVWRLTQSDGRWLVCT